MKISRRAFLGAAAGAIAGGCKLGPRLCVPKVGKIEGPRFVDIDIRYTAGDVEYLESRKFNAAEIARLFDVPPHLITDRKSQRA